MVVGALVLHVVIQLVILLLVIDMRLGGTIVALSLKGTTDHVFSLVVVVVLP